MAEELRRKSDGDRLTVLETKFDIHAAQVSSLVDSHKETNEKLDQLIIMAAEARGAGHMMKWLGGAAVAVIGAVSGLIGGSVSAASKAAEHIK